MPQTLDQYWSTLVLLQIFILPPYKEALGFEPMPVSRVAPDWDL